MKKVDWEFWFPERLPYEFLVKEKKKDPDGFAIKYLNNPRQIHKVKFPRELLVRRTIPHTQMPPSGVVVTVVDCAYSVKNWADFTVIITAMIFGGRFFIINMKRGRYNEYDLPKVIANVAYTRKPKRIAIEDSVGVKWMGRELRREMDALQVYVPVEYVSLGLGSKSNSKKMKAKPVLRLLGDDRMSFLNSCEGLEEIYSEMEKFTGTEADTHDDIVSGLSLLCEVFGSYAEQDHKVNYINNDYIADKEARRLHSIIYGLGAYRKYNASMNGEENPMTSFQLGQIAGATDVNDDFGDPLADLF